MRRAGQPRHRVRDVLRDRLQSRPARCRSRVESPRTRARGDGSPERAGSAEFFCGGFVVAASAEDSDAVVDYRLGRTTRLQHVCDQRFSDTLPPALSWARATRSEHGVLGRTRRRWRDWADSRRRGGRSVGSPPCRRTNPARCHRDARLSAVRILALTRRPDVYRVLAFDPARSSLDSIPQCRIKLSVAKRAPGVEYRLPP